MSTSDHDVVSRFPIDSPSKTSVNFDGSWPNSLQPSPDKHAKQLEYDNGGARAYEEGVSYEDASTLLAIGKGDKEQKFQVYTEADFGNPFLNGKKSRLAVFEFCNIKTFKMEKFTNEVVKAIWIARQSMSGGFGFNIKSSTYFVWQNKLQIALISYDALAVKKWCDVFNGIDANHVKIFYNPENLRDSIYGIVEMFPEVNIQRIIKNKINYKNGGKVKGVRTENHRNESGMGESKKRKLDMSESPQKVRWESKRSEQMELRKVEPLERAPVSAGSNRKGGVNKKQARIVKAILKEETGKLVPTKLFEDKISEDEVFQSCIQFLMDESLESAATHFKVLKSYIATMSENEGRLGSFLFDGYLHKIFVHYLHMRDSVLRMLAEKGMELKNLTRSEICEHAFFKTVAQEVQAHLEDIGSATEKLEKEASFFPVDTISIQVFASVYILSQQKEIADGGSNEDFLGVHETALSELLQLFAQALYVLNRFVLAMIDWGYVDRRSYEGMFERILFPPEFTQHDVTRDFVGKLFRVKHQSTQSVGKSFRITRFNSAIRYITGKYLAPKGTGRAVEVWNASQHYRTVLLNIRPGEDAYFCLPASDFSPNVGLHSQDPKDVEKIFEDHL